MRQGDELVLRVGQIHVTARRQRILFVAALFESEIQVLGVAAGAIQGVAQAVEAGLPRRQRVFDTVFGGHHRPGLVALGDLLEDLDGDRLDVGLFRGAHGPSAHVTIGRMAGIAPVMTLLVTPGLGSATPIRQSRVTISVS